MNEIHDLLERAAGDDPIGFTAADVENRVRLRRNRRRRLVSGLSVLVLLAVAAGTWSVFDRPDGLQVATDPDVNAPGERLDGSEPDEREDVPPLEIPPFKVIHIGEARAGHLGLLAAVTDTTELEQLLVDIGMDGSTAGAQLSLAVNFARQVVVAVIIPDDLCPPELVDIAVDGKVLTPVFEQPDVPCAEPLRARAYVVALSQELAPPGSIWRYPDTPDLQMHRRGPTEIPIWTQPESESESEGESGSPTRNAFLVQIYFTPEEWGGRDCSVTAGAMRERPVDDTLADALPFVLEELLAGPTAHELVSGYTSWFSAETAGMLRSVDVSEGVAHVDFENFAPLLNNASTSCGSASLMSSLDRTVTQFVEIEKAVYYFDGDAVAFYGWLQSTPPPEARPLGW